MGKESMDKVTRVFFQHRPDTCMKYYVRHVSNLECIRLSMDCVRNYGVSYRTSDASSGIDQSLDEQKSRFAEVRDFFFQ